ncbi:MAG: hypothetical protein PWR11_650 [Bacillota bacterium]|nr:hypothetical protein [Bacillota bacterium]
MFPGYEYTAYSLARQLSALPGCLLAGAAVILLARLTLQAVLAGSGLRHFSGLEADAVAVAALVALAAAALSLTSSAGFAGAALLPLGGATAQGFGLGGLYQQAAAPFDAVSRALDVVLSFTY